MYLKKYSSLVAKGEMMESMWPIYVTVTEALIVHCSLGYIHTSDERGFAVWYDDSRWFPQTALWVSSCLDGG